MKLWEYRIKQYTYNLSESKIQQRSKQNYEVEEILGDLGKEGYELINVITEPIIGKKGIPEHSFLRTFFLKKERILKLIKFDIIKQ